MKSDRPKVLHTLAGRPLVRWVLSSVRRLRPQKVFLVVGHKHDQVERELAGENVSFALQRQQLGSGHALRQTEKQFKGYTGDIIVLCGDTPLITSETLRALLAAHRRGRHAATVLSALFPDPYGYGRIVRDADGFVREIVEEKDATPEQRQIREINSGIYCFQGPELWKALSRVKAENRKHEYYLTDVIAILNGQGRKVGAFSLGQPEEILGVNTRVDLARAEGLMRRRLNEDWMLSGVTIIDPSCTYISAEASIGQDTVILPGTIIEGNTKVGRGCVIGPGSLLRDAVIGNAVEVRLSVVTGASVADNGRIGPFSHLRPGAVLKENVKVGNFSEVKKSVVGAGSKVNHLSYIGDSFLGRNVNVGAGTITCNYDGVKKSTTVIGDRAFVGSNVNLVAPVRVGADVVLGAGSTITEDVPERSLAIARARQINKTRGKRTGE
jgi:bifunctional UDP-N-acetylglucosamine pyrophosphorylase/glucosamine-1-phosphate N-acetyltransferase